MAEEGPGQNGPPGPEQWLPMRQRGGGAEKGEKRPTTLGSGALHFIRTRSSIRRELKRHSNQSKAAENVVPGENFASVGGGGAGGGGGGGGGIGKWLREHLGGSRGSHEVNASSVKRTGSGSVDGGTLGPGEKSMPRLTTYASQNLYCSLPREHGRPFPCNSVLAGVQKKVNAIEIPQAQNRPRSNSANFYTKNAVQAQVIAAPVIRRGGPGYSSDGKSMRRRNRDRRRHSLNELQDERALPGREKCVADDLPTDVASPDNLDEEEEKEEQYEIKDEITNALKDVITDEVRNEITIDTNDGDDKDEDDDLENEEVEKEEEEEEEEEAEVVVEEKHKSSLQEDKVHVFWGEEKDGEDREQEQEEEVEEEEEEEEEEEDEEEEEQHTVEDELPIDYAFPAKKERVKSETDLSKIPLEVCGDRNAMLLMLQELIRERPILTFRNKYLEYKCFNHLQTLQVTRSPPIDDISDLQDEAEKDRYMHFLGYYKKEFETVRERENQIQVSLDSNREKLKDLSAKDEEVFQDLTSRETAVAVDLIFASTGRRLTQKRVEEMIHRQTARRKLVAHERYTFIRKWYNFEDMDARLRRLETLGPGMTVTDHQAQVLSNLTVRTKIDEKNKELQKARARVCSIMMAITHGKVKLAHLRDEIASKKNLHNLMANKVHVHREELSSMRSDLSRTRASYVKKREEAGLLLALPTLRKMEEVMELRDVWRTEVDRLQSETQTPRRRSTRKGNQDEELSSSTNEMKHFSHLGKN